MFVYIASEIFFTKVGNIWYANNVKKLTLFSLWVRYSDSSNFQ